MFFHKAHIWQGVSRISGKGVHIYKGVGGGGFASRGESRICGKMFIYIKVWGVRFADFILFFLNTPWK